MTEVALGTLAAFAFWISGAIVGIAIGWHWRERHWQGDSDAMRSMTDDPAE